MESATKPSLGPELHSRLERIYRPDEATRCAAAVHELLDEYRAELDASLASAPAGWDERDVVLITYADQLRDSGEAPLATLGRFLVEEGLDDLLRTVHLLPFFPYSSDDGFSVIDYLRVDPNAGDWPDVTRLADYFELMFDLVINHISQHSDWFQDYLAGREPYDRFFVEVDPSLDLSAVVRPRSLPLLTPVETSRGPRHVWTTFSADQIDLNYANPDVLVRMIGVLLEYVRRGARIVRLDAVAFLWKEIGTNCLHLPQTHEVVKLLRDILTAVAPHVVLLTETNVPHDENVSYFGNGDEAQMVYQFSLPPLLLDAFVNGDAGPITEWLRGLDPPLPGTTYFNFTASHDGVGVRPLEGLVSAERFERLCDHVRSRGGLISTRRQEDGSDTPYELNIAYVDALAPDTSDLDLHARRFLATQAVMLALQGMPAIYFHSLVGSRNDDEGANESGQPRRINRHKYEWDELRSLIHPSTSESPTSLPQGDDAELASRIYAGYRHLLAERVRQPAFHPDAAQRVIDSANPAILAFQRTSVDGSQHILAAVNVSDSPHQLDVSRVGHFERDLIGGQSVDEDGNFQLAPGQAVWLR